MMVKVARLRFLRQALPTIAFMIAATMAGYAIFAVYGELSNNVDRAERDDIAATEARKGDNNHLARMGQKGDAFGTLNTLFSGSAFALLIFTTLCQLLEMAENRRSTRREQREQFLSARLNARSALAQATTPIPDTGKSSSTEDVIAYSEMVWRASQQRLLILLEEVNFGVDDERWTPRIERRALREYCLRILGKTSFRYSDATQEMPISNLATRENAQIVKMMQAEITMLAHEFGKDYWDILNIMKTGVREIETIRMKACTMAKELFEFNRHCLEFNDAPEPESPNLPFYLAPQDTVLFFVRPDHNLVVRSEQMTFPPEPDDPRHFTRMTDALRTIEDRLRKLPDETPPKRDSLAPLA